MSCSKLANKLYLIGILFGPWRWRHCIHLKYQVVSNYTESHHKRWYSSGLVLLYIYEEVYILHLLQCYYYFSIFLSFEILYFGSDCQLSINSVGLSLRNYCKCVIYKWVSRKLDHQFSSLVWIVRLSLVLHCYYFPWVNNHISLSE